MRWEPEDQLGQAHHHSAQQVLGEKFTAI